MCPPSCGTTAALPTVPPLPPRALPRVPCEAVTPVSIKALPRLPCQSVSSVPPNPFPRVSCEAVSPVPPKHPPRMPCEALSPVPSVQSDEGLTPAERERLMLRLNTRRPPPCARCIAYRGRLLELQREFERLRAQLIAKPLVEPREARPKMPPKMLDLAEEGAKLRITIDTIMRSQVRYCCLCRGFERQCHVD